VFLLPATFLYQHGKQRSWLDKSVLLWGHHFSKVSGHNILPVCNCQSNVPTLSYLTNPVSHCPAIPSRNYFGVLLLPTRKEKILTLDKSMSVWGQAFATWGEELPPAKQDNNMSVWGHHSCYGFQASLQLEAKSCHRQKSSTFRTVSVAHLSSIHSSVFCNLVALMFQTSPCTVLSMAVQFLTGMLSFGHVYYILSFLQLGIS